MSTSNLSRPKLCGNKCVVCGKSKFSQPGLKLFLFPRKDIKRCAEWISNTGYFELNNLPVAAKRYVCQYHFTDDCYMSKLKNKLMPSAVPIRSNFTEPSAISKSEAFKHRSTLSSKRPKVCGNKCVVCGKSKFSNPGLKMFVFPRRDEKRCEQWVLNTGYLELRQLPMEAKRYVCEYHFTNNCFMSKLRNRLTPTAVPIKTVPSVDNSQMQFTNHQLTTSSNHSENQIQLETSHLNTLPTENHPVSVDQAPVQTSGLRTYLCSFKVASGSEDQWHLHQESPRYVETNLDSYETTRLNYNCLTNNSNADITACTQNEPKTNENVCTNLVDVDKQQYIPMTQPYFKRNSRPTAPCKHCKKKDKTILALRTRIRELKKITLKQRIDHLKNVSKDAKTFAKMFLTHGNRRVWSEEEKTFAIDLLAKSSSAYSFLRKRKRIILPAQASIYTWMKERDKGSCNLLDLKNYTNPENVITKNIIIDSVSNHNVVSTDHLTEMIHNPNQGPNLQQVQTEQPAESAYKLAYQIIADNETNENTYILQLNGNS